MTNKPEPVCFALGRITARLETGRHRLGLYEPLLATEFPDSMPIIPAGYVEVFQKEQLDRLADELHVAGYGTPLAPEKPTVAVRLNGAQAVAIGRLLGGRGIKRKTTTRKALLVLQESIGEVAQHLNGLEVTEALNSIASWLSEVPE